MRSGKRFGRSAGIAVAAGLVLGLLGEPATDRAAAEDGSFEERWEIFGERQKLRVVPHLSRIIQPVCDAMAISLRLEPEMARRLDDLAEEAIDQSFEAYLAECHKRLDAMGEAERETALSRFFLRNAPNYRDAQFDPLKQDAWTGGLTSVLDADQRKQWQAREEKLATENIALHRDQLLVLIHRDVGVRARDRDALGPAIADALRNSQVSSRSPGASLSSASYGALFQDDDRRRKVVSALEETAAERLDVWLRSLARRSEILELKLPERRDGEAEEVHRERVVAAMIQAQIDLNVRQHHDLWANRLEEVEGIADLQPDQRAELELAIEGMAELVADQLAGAYEGYARNFVSRVRDGNYQAILKNLRTYRFDKMGDESLWHSTLGRVLHPDQKQRLDDVRAERSRFAHVVALRRVRFVGEELLTILPEQWNRLEPLIEKVIEGRLSDLERQSSNRDPWYFDVRKVAFAYHAIGDNELREILNERQWRTWSARLRPGAEMHVRAIERLIEFRKQAREVKKEP